MKVASSSVPVADARSTWWDQLAPRLRAYVPFKFVAICALYAAFFPVYFLLLKFALFPVTLMLPTWLDRVIPFQPNSVLLYVSLWLYIPMAAGLISSMRELLLYYAALIVLATIGCTIFLFWPTASLRPDIDWFWQGPVGPLIALDESGNALPSLHAAFAVFSAIWLDRHLRWTGTPIGFRIFSAVWGLGILYSTLATKQHVAVDIYAGAALGWAAAAAHLWCLRRWKVL